MQQSQYQTVSVEVASEGYFETVQFCPTEIANGLFGVLPAHLPHKVCWNVHVEFIHCYLEPAFLAQIAHESVKPDRVELSLETKKHDFLIQQMGLALKADLEVDGIGDCFYADSLATAMAAHLVRHYSTRKHSFRSHAVRMIVVGRSAPGVISIVCTARVVFILDDSQSLGWFGHACPFGGFIWGEGSGFECDRLKQLQQMN